MLTDSYINVPQVKVIWREVNRLIWFHSVHTGVRLSVAAVLRIGSHSVKKAAFRAPLSFLFLIAFHIYLLFKIIPNGNVTFLSLS